MIRVLLVDDHDLVRTGIRKVLEDTVGIEVVGEASTGEEALEAVRLNPPDVVLMDINMPGMGGLEATRQIKRLRNSTRVVAVSMHEEGVFPKKLLEAGASGYLTKGSSADEVIQAIRSVKQGKRYISREVAQILALDSVENRDTKMDELSQRELQVMRMVTQGRSNNDIAEVLHLSPKTISTYRSRIFSKLEVKSDVELTHLAYRHGIINPADDGA